MPGPLTKAQLAQLDKTLKPFSEFPYLKELKTFIINLAKDCSYFQELLAFGLESKFSFRLSSKKVEDPSGAAHYNFKNHRITVLQEYLTNALKSDSQLWDAFLRSNLVHESTHMQHARLPTAEHVKLSIKALRYGEATHQVEDCMLATDGEGLAHGSLARTPPGAPPEPAAPVYFPAMATGGGGPNTPSIEEVKGWALGGLTRGSSKGVRLPLTLLPGGAGVFGRTLDETALAQARDLLARQPPGSIPIKELVQLENLFTRGSASREYVQAWVSLTQESRTKLSQVLFISSNLGGYERQYGVDTATCIAQLSKADPACLTSMQLPALTADPMQRHLDILGACGAEVPRGDCSVLGMEALAAAKEHDFMRPPLDLDNPEAASSMCRVQKAPEKPVNIAKVLSVLSDKPAKAEKSAQATQVDPSTSWGWPDAASSVKTATTGFTDGFIDGASPAQADDSWIKRGAIIVVRELLRAGIMWLCNAEPEEILGALVLAGAINGFSKTLGKTTGPAVAVASAGVSCYKDGAAGLVIFVAQTGLNMGFRIVGQTAGSTARARFWKEPPAAPAAAQTSRQQANNRRRKRR